MSVYRWRLRGLLGVLALLVIGGVIGAALDRAVVRRHGVETHGAHDHQRLLTTLRHEIDLDDSQVEEIREILHRYQARVEHAWESVRPVMATAADSVEHEIEQILRPDQIEPFRTWHRGQTREELEGRGEH